MTELGPASARREGPASRVDGDPVPALPQDASRTDMMRRESRLSLAARIALFEALSRDAAWAGSAERIR